MLCAEKQGNKPWLKPSLKSLILPLVSLHVKYRLRSITAQNQHQHISKAAAFLCLRFKMQEKMFYIYSIYFWWLKKLIFPYKWHSLEINKKLTGNIAVICIPSVLHTNPCVCSTWLNSWLLLWLINGHCGQEDKCFWTLCLTLILSVITATSINSVSACFLKW